MDLKAALIDFMRERPFLWNNKDPDYKDTKKRELEFESFADQVKLSVKEIKRVWHVLRTNFFRAHKLMSERPPGDDKLWKYYLSMSYILETAEQSNTDTKYQTYAGYTDQGPFTNESRANNSAVDDNSFVLVTGAEGEGAEQQHQNRDVTIATTDGQNPLDEVAASAIADYNPTTPSAARKRFKKANSSANTNSTNNNNNSNANRSSTNNNSNNHNMSNVTGNNILPPDGLNLTDQVELDDELYAKSLACTLRKFDPTTKEIIKLKFQEIVVRYMQQRRKVYIVSRK